MTAAPVWNGRHERWAVPAADLLESVGRWLFVAAVAAAMLTPRFAFGPVRLGVSDILGAGGSACWALAWMSSGSRPANLRPALWPALVFAAGMLSMTQSLDIGASLKGLAQLLGLWILPSMAIVGLFTTSRWRTRLLSAASAGALLAAVINVVAAVRIGMGGGLPQVWGAASGFQGYFQVVGLTVAVPRLATALSARQVPSGLGWSLAVLLHSAALLLTQTRGAWLAALLAVVALGFVWRRVLLVAACLGVLAALTIGLSGDWAGVVRERVQSVFQPEASLSGFDSSVMRIALAFVAWNMFLAYPLTGIGLKNFVFALPYYAPEGLPLVVDMGSDQIPFAIEGPHSTYLSLLAETGLLGAVAVVGWVAGGWRRTYRWNRALPVADTARRQIGATLLGAIAAIGVSNLFNDMNASGAIPLTMVLALGHAFAAEPPTRAARV